MNDSGTADERIHKCHVDENDHRPERLLCGGPLIYIKSDIKLDDKITAIANNIWYCAVYRYT